MKWVHFVCDGLFTEIFHTISHKKILIRKKSILSLFYWKKDMASEAK